MAWDAHEGSVGGSNGAIAGGATQQSQQQAQQPSHQQQQMQQEQLTPPPTPPHPLEPPPSPLHHPPHRMPPDRSLSTVSNTSGIEAPPHVDRRHSVDPFGSQDSTHAKDDALDVSNSARAASSGSKGSATGSASGGGCQQQPMTTAPMPPSASTSTGERGDGNFASAINYVRAADSNMSSNIIASSGGGISNNATNLDTNLSDIKSSPGPGSNKIPNAASPDTNTSNTFSAKFHKWLTECAWPGMGLFGESYLLFSVGTLKPVWELLYPECFAGSSYGDAGGNSNGDNGDNNGDGDGNNDWANDDDSSSPREVVCTDALLRSITYSVVLGVITGMILLGTLSNRIGRRAGSIATASLMAGGALGMSIAALLLDEKPDKLFGCMSGLLFVFGVGVGGEYPLSAASASERGMAELRRRTELEQQKEQQKKKKEEKEREQQQQQHRENSDPTFAPSTQAMLRNDSTGDSDATRLTNNASGTTADGSNNAASAQAPAPAHHGPTNAAAASAALSPHAAESLISPPHFASLSTLSGASPTNNGGGGAKGMSEDLLSKEDYGYGRVAAASSPRFGTVHPSLHPSLHQSASRGVNRYRYHYGGNYRYYGGEDDAGLTLTDGRRSKRKKMALKAFFSSLKGNNVLLVFTMQGLGVFVNSLTITLLLLATNQLGNKPDEYDDSSNGAARMDDDYEGADDNYVEINEDDDALDGLAAISGYYDTDVLLAIWQIVYAIGAFVLLYVLISRIIHLTESEVWKADREMRERQKLEGNMRKCLREQEGMLRSTREAQEMQEHVDGRGGDKDAAAAAFAGRRNCNSAEVRVGFVAPTLPDAQQQQQQQQPLSQGGTDAGSGGDSTGDKVGTVVRTVTTPSTPTPAPAGGTVARVGEVAGAEARSAYGAQRNEPDLLGASADTTASPAVPAVAGHNSPQASFNKNGADYGGFDVLRSMSSLSAPSAVGHSFEYGAGAAAVGLRQVPSTTSEYDRKSSANHLLLRNYGYRLLGTSLSWLLWDVAFYGNKLFQSSFLVALTGEEVTLFELTGAATLNALVALLGYFAAAFVVDVPCVGRLRLQKYGFFVTGLLFVSCGFLKGSLSTSWLVIMYFFSSFFGQCGPNATTFLIPAEIFPTECRTMCHGISAASGKLGALIAAVLFNYVDEVQLFLISGYCSFAASMITHLTIPETTTLDLYEIDRKWRMILAGRKGDYDGPANAPQYMSYVERRKVGLEY